MAEKRSRRRGKGGLSKYKTRQGERWRWQLYVPADLEHPELGEKRIGKAGFATMAEAEDSMQEAIRERRTTGTVHDTRTADTTIKAYAQQWLDALDTDELAQSTIELYRRIVKNQISPEIGAVAVARLTPTRIARLYRDLRDHGRCDGKHKGEPLSANSVNKAHIVLGAMLDAAVADGLILQNPARVRKIVKAPTGSAIRKARPEIHTWSGEQLAKFLDWDHRVFNDDLFELWRVLAYTGMRRSEALALRWGDFTSKPGRLSVRRAVDIARRGQTKTPKTDRPRVIDLDEQTVELLMAYKKTRGSLRLDFARADAYIFGRISDNALRSPNEVSRRWKYRVAKARETLDIPTITIKELRHTHATILLEAGVPAKVVQERLGHSTIQVTMDIYSHVTATMQASAVSAFTKATSTSVST